MPLTTCPSTELSASGCWINVARIAKIAHMEAEAVLTDTASPWTLAVAWASVSCVSVENTLQ